LTEKGFHVKYKYNFRHALTIPQIASVTRRSEEEIKKILDPHEDK
jgi:hypothetical protein